jgi:TonB family protein
MSQLQKKCFLASAGFHSLLFGILLIGPAFFVSHDKPEDMPILEFIPDKLIDEPFSGGGNPQVQTPPPQQQTPPPQQQTPPPQPRQEARQPDVKPPEPKPQPRAESKPAEQPRKYNTADNIKISTKPVDRKVSTTPAKRQPDVGKAIAAATSTLNKNLSSSTSIDTPAIGAGGGPAYASYAQAIKTLYERAWEAPRESSRDDAIVKVRVVILRDGTIRSASIVDRCGDSMIDASVEAALRRVDRAPRFPEESKDKERVFVIGFNLRARLTG